MVLAYAIVRIGGPASFWSDKIRVTAYFSSANGLRPGNDVWLDGLLVGKVDRCRARTRIPMTRAGSPSRWKSTRPTRTYLRKDSVVGIESNGLLGDKTIQITSGSETAEPVGDGGSPSGHRGRWHSEESFREPTKSSATSKRSATISPGSARMSSPFPKTSIGTGHVWKTADKLRNSRQPQLDGAGSTETRRGHPDRSRHGGKADFRR